MANSCVSSRNLHVRVGEDELAHFAIEREAIHAMAGGDDQQRSTGRRGQNPRTPAANRAGGSHPAWRPRRACWSRRIEKMVPTVIFTSIFEEPSSGSNTSRYLPRFLACRNRVEVVHLLRRHAGKVAGPFVGLDHHVVGDDVELLLRFALDVLARRRCPSTPISAPLDTALLMTLQAVAMSLSRPVKSPVAPATWDCSSMMNWVSVVRPSCMDAVLPFRVLIFAGRPRRRTRPEENPRPRFARGAGQTGCYARGSGEAWIGKPRSDNGNLAGLTISAIHFFLSCE